MGGSELALTCDGAGAEGGGALGHLVKVWYDRPVPGRPTVLRTPRWLMLTFAPRGPKPRLTPDPLKLSLTSPPNRTVFLNLNPMPTTVPRAALRFTTHAKA